MVDTEISTYEKQQVGVGAQIRDWSRRRGVGQCRHVSGQVGGRDVGEGHAVEDLAHIGPQCDPQGEQRLGGAGVGQVRRADPAHRDERSVHDADHIRDADGPGGLGQPVAAVAASLAEHETAPAHVVQDALEELVRDVLGVGDGLRLHRPVVLRRGKLQRGTYRIVRPG